MREELLKDRPETLEENYTLNWKKECNCKCSSKKKGIEFLNKKTK